MAQLILSICDACAAESETGETAEPGVPIKVSLGNGTAYEVDLCALHRKSLVDPLQDLISAAGRTVAVSVAPAAAARVADASPRINCPLCGASLKNLGSVGAHLSSKHRGYTVAELQREGKLPESTGAKRTCGLCGVVMDPGNIARHMQSVHPLEAPALQCPTCGRQQASQQGLASHMRMHNERDLPCPECGEMFHSPQGLGRHRQAIHEVAGTARV